MAVVFYLSSYFFSLIIILMSDVGRDTPNELDSIKAVDGMAKLLVQDRDGKMGFPATAKSRSGEGVNFLYFNFL